MHGLNRLQVVTRLIQALQVLGKGTPHCSSQLRPSVFHALL